MIAGRYYLDYRTMKLFQSSLGDEQVELTTVEHLCRLLADAQVHEPLSPPLFLDSTSKFPSQYLRPERPTVCVPRGLKWDRTAWCGLLTRGQRTVSQSTHSCLDRFDMGGGPVSLGPSRNPEVSRREQ